MQIIWPRLMAREHFQGVHNNVFAEYLADEAAAAVAPHFEKKTRYDVEFPRSP